MNDEPDAERTYTAMEPAGGVTPVGVFVDGFVFVNVPVVSP